MGIVPTSFKKRVNCPSCKCQMDITGNIVNEYFVCSNKNCSFCGILREIEPFTIGVDCE